jgi:hypothetical protein
MDLPEVKNQRTPSFSAAEGDHRRQRRALHAALRSAGGIGLAIEEVFALQVKDVWAPWSAFATVYGGASSTRRRPRLASGRWTLTLQLLNDCRSTSANGRRPSSSRLGGHAGILKTMGKPNCGFHAFRRFRITHLRKLRVPDDLIQLWVGHAPKTITDEYSRLKDVEFRRFTAEQAGLSTNFRSLLFLLHSRICIPKLLYLLEKIGRGERISTSEQRPGTAKGIVFLTVHDETDFCDVVVKPAVYEQYRALVNKSKFLQVQGRLQKVENAAMPGVYAMSINGTHLFALDFPKIETHPRHFH